VGDLAATVADLAGDRLGTGRRAGPRTGRAQDGGVDLELPGGAERGLAEIDPERDQRVLAAPGPRPGPAGGPAGLAEEGVHDVGEGEGLPEAGTARSCSGGRERVAAEIVQLPLLRVAQHLEGAADLLELVVRVLGVVHVRVVLAGQLAVRLLDLVR
jgi:hypothetical protein